jgi:hypothetical protein
MFRWAAVAGAAVMLASCNDTKTPVNPGSVLPQIVSISPSPIVASPAPQTLTIAGNQFVAGLRLLVTAPDGVTVTVQGEDIAQVQNTSFRATTILNRPGAHVFVVENDNGGRSDAFTTTVEDSATARPTISSVTPSSMPPSLTSTIVALQGANFAPGLVVNVTDPTGTTVVLGPASIGLQTTTRVEFSFVFSTTGLYTVTIRNATGDTSNPVTITVN